MGLAAARKMVGGMVMALPTVKGVGFHGLAAKGMAGERGTAGEAMVTAMTHGMTTGALEITCLHPTKARITGHFR